jgi:hypothetical protein
VIEQVVEDLLDDEKKIEDYEEHRTASVSHNEDQTAASMRNGAS